MHRIAEYVQRWGGYVLRPDHARHLRGLLARGESEAAVELYFALVGKRWDKEWLVTAVVGINDVRNVAADYLIRNDAHASFHSLAVAPATGSPDGSTAVVVLTAEVHPPIVNFLIPDGIRIEATSTARSRLVR